MRKKAFALLLSAILLWSLTGCSPHKDGYGLSDFRVVTAVTVFFDNGPINVQRHYTTDAKMQRILDYLRLISPYGTPGEDPESAAGSDYHIVLSYSDGKQKVYRQKGDRFLQGTDGRWQNIDPEKAADLSKIVGQLESDGIL